MFLSVLCGAAAWCIYRDIRIEKEYTGDLRNRVVGARLQKDGLLPYFHKWKTGEGLRYYDPQNFDSLKVSNITASPFFHQLLYPLAEFEERSISRLWLALEYLLFSGLVILGFRQAQNRMQQFALLTAAVIFLFTNSWTGHLAAGQLYLLIPFVAMIFYLAIQKKKIGFPSMVAGLSAATLLLIRPTTVFFLLPFLLIIKSFPARYLFIFFISLFTLLAVAIGTGRSPAFWNQYRLAVTEQVKSHQDLKPALQSNDPDPGYQSWEGWDLEKIKTNSEAFPYHYNQDHGNLFVFLNRLLPMRIPVWLSGTFAIISMLLLFFLFYINNRDLQSLELSHLAILAFCIYMVTDICSPIHRFQYNGVQWIFPVLLFTSGYQSRNKWILGLIITGMIINGSPGAWILMQQTLGEYLICFGLILFLLKPKPRLAI